MQRQLVDRAQSGDHEAFSVLVRTSYPRLYGVANLVLRDRDRAQDAVQDGHPGGGPAPEDGTRRALRAP